jgi:hypothetical protein
MRSSIKKLGYRALSIAFFNSNPPLRGRADAEESAASSKPESQSTAATKAREAIRPRCHPGRRSVRPRRRNWRNGTVHRALSGPAKWHAFWSPLLFLPRLWKPNDGSNRIRNSRVISSQRR